MIFPETTVTTRAQAFGAIASPRPTFRHLNTAQPKTFGQTITTPKFDSGTKVFATPTMSSTCLFGNAPDAEHTPMFGSKNTPPGRSKAESAFSSLSSYHNSSTFGSQSQISGSTFCRTMTTPSFGSSGSVFGNNMVISQSQPTFGAGSDLFLQSTTAQSNDNAFEWSDVFAFKKNKTQNPASTTSADILGSPNTSSNTPFVYDNMNTNSALSAPLSSPSSESISPVFNCKTAHEAFSSNAPIMSTMSSTCLFGNAPGAQNTLMFGFNNTTPVQPKAEKIFSSFSAYQISSTPTFGTQCPISGTAFSEVEEKNPATPIVSKILSVPSYNITPSSESKYVRSTSRKQPHLETKALLDAEKTPFENIFSAPAKCDLLNNRVSPSIKRKQSDLGIKMSVDKRAKHKHEPTKIDFTCAVNKSKRSARIFFGQNSKEKDKKGDSPESKSIKKPLTLSSQNSCSISIDEESIEAIKMYIDNNMSDEIPAIKSDLSMPSKEYLVDTLSEIHGTQVKLNANKPNMKSKLVEVLQPTRITRSQTKKHRDAMQKTDSKDSRFKINKSSSISSINASSSSNSPMQNGKTGTNTCEDEIHTTSYEMTGPIDEYDDKQFICVIEKRKSSAIKNVSNLSESTVIETNKIFLKNNVEVLLSPSDLMELYSQNVDSVAELVRELQNSRKN